MTKTINIRRKGLQSFRKELDVLKKNKRDFKVTKTSSTSTIEVVNDEGKVKTLFSSSYTPMNVLGKMKAMKSEVLRNSAKVLEAPYSDSPYDIAYFDFKPSIYDLKHETGCVYDFKNVYEADITSAYYKTALNLGFISQDMFNECMLIDKRHRMKILGSIATSKTIYHYKGGKLTKHIYSEKDELLRSAWFKICSYVNNAMQYLKEAMGDNFIFYWVDGIYFTCLENENTSFDGYQEKEIYDMYLKLVEEFNFKWKIEKLNKVSVKNIDNILYMEVVKSNKTKTFNIPRKSVKYYGLGNKSKFIN